MSAVISARNLSKRYKGKPAVDGISFDIPAGRIVGLIGPNGSGKTTTLRALLGLVRADSGRMSVLGEPSPELLSPGDVLVAAATDAGWSPVFLRAGAIVVERGGPLSHAAIVARELGLPAVLNLPGATAVLDGRRVTVDGDSGVVVLIPEEDRP